MKRRFIRTAIIVMIFALINASVCVYAENSSDPYEAPSERPSAVTEYAPGEVIVSFSEDLSPKKERAILQDAVESEPENVQITDLDSNTVLLDTEGAADVSELIESLQDNPAIEDAQPNYCYTLDSSSEAGLETVSAMYSTWYMDYMDVPEAWAVIEGYQKDGTIENPSRRVSIAILDSGINLNHEDMKDIRSGGNFDLAHCKTALSGLDPDSSWYDPSTGEKIEYPHPRILHGSKTASIIGATSGNNKGIDGIAAGDNNDIASIMAINVFRNNFNSEFTATSADIIAGIDYACRNNARVIMMCLGHAPGSLDGNGNLIDDAALEAKINWAAEEKDVVFVTSAGNRNTDSAWYPSDFDACISVINTKKYSNIESISCRNSSSSFGRKKDLSAPGTGITACSTAPDGYSPVTGTSFSASMVASVAGLVRYVNPSLTQQEVKDILYRTATDLYIRGYDIYTGYGNVNAYAAVTAAAGEPARIYPRRLEPTKVTSEGTGKSTIKLTWRSVGADRYCIYRSTKPHSGFSKAATVTGTSWTDTRRAFNKRYYYKIVPKGTSADGKRTDGGFSNAASARAICGKPSITVKAKGKHIARVYWGRAKDASGYQIYRSAYPNSKFKLVKTVKGAKKGSVAVKKLKYNKTYYYKVRAYVKRNGKVYYGPFSPAYACTQK